jgi:hypothetical protein
MEALQQLSCHAAMFAPSPTGSISARISIEMLCGTSCPASSPLAGED